MQYLKQFEYGQTYLKRRSVAQRYGVTERTIRNWVDAGTFPPPLKIGRSILWRVDDLLEHEAKGGAK